MVNKKVLSSLLCLGVLGNVSFGGIPLKASSVANVSLNHTYQEIDGFGVSQAGWSGAIYDLEEPARSEVMDLLFSEEGIDLDIFRGEIFPAFSTVLGEYDFTQRQDQVWVMQEAKARGVDKIMATTWSPPAWMKTNNQTTHGGYLKKEYYDEYADLMAQFVKEYKNRYDLDLYAVSMSNEPNSMTFLTWDSCEWTGGQIKDFLANYLKPKFEAEGLDKVKVIAAEPSWWSEDMMKPALNDPVASSRIDIVGAHNYPIPILNVKQPQNPFKVAQSKGKRVWMTEVSSTQSYDPTITSGIELAKEMHGFMTKVGANAYLYWTGAIPGNNDEGLINVDLETSTYSPTKRYYAFGNFGKFIKPGYERIDMTENPISGVYTSAYTDPGRNEVFIVAINDSNEKKEFAINPTDFYAETLIPYVTSDSYNLEELDPITASRGLFEATLPPRSITTYVGTLEDRPVPTVETFYDSLDNWDYVHEYTTGAALDISSPNKFGKDSSRVKRLTEDTEYIVYQIDGIESFEATLYHHTEWDGVAFYSSEDGENWVRVPHESTTGRLVSIGWYRKIYSSVPALTKDNNYLKIELSGPGAWNKQIGDVTIKYRK